MWELTPKMTPNCLWDRYVNGKRSLGMFPPFYLAFPGQPRFEGFTDQGKVIGCEDSPSPDPYRLGHLPGAKKISDVVRGAIQYSCCIGK
jgi:hypothetical protein